MNNLFQRTFFLLRRFWSMTTGEPVVDGRVNIASKTARMFAAFKIARFFGGVKQIIIGDSNAECLNTLNRMKRFKRLTVNLGVGGSTADDWIAYFATEEGKQLLALIHAARPLVVWNIGGNNALQDKMTGAKAALQACHDLFVESYNINIPPIRTDWIEQLGKLAGVEYDAIAVGKRVSKINNLIWDIWGDRVIDMRLVFQTWFDTNKESYFLVLQDFVHYSEAADIKVRIPIINAL